MNRTLFFVSILTLYFSFTPFSNAEVRTLDWDDLMPSDWSPENPFDRLDQDQLNNLIDGSSEANLLMQEMQAILASAPVVEKFNGSRVRLPGFPVPLAGDAEHTTELLLVPYFGACIHTPPPPSNQIVYVKSELGLPIDDIWQPVWITGTLNTEHFDSDLGSAGYTLQAEQMEIYTGEE